MGTRLKVWPRKPTPLLGQAPALRLAGSRLRFYPPLYFGYVAKLLYGLTIPSPYHDQAHIVLFNLTFHAYGGALLSTVV